jgi:hypothetical protein
VLRTSNAYAFTDPSPAADRPFGRKEALRDEGGILAGKNNRAPAGDSNLATAAAFYRLAIQLDEVVSNLALMGFFEG